MSFNEKKLCDVEAKSTPDSEVFIALLLLLSPPCDDGKVAVDGILLELKTEATPERKLELNGLKVELSIKEVVGGLEFEGVMLV